MRFLSTSNIMLIWGIAVLIGYLLTRKDVLGIIGNIWLVGSMIVSKLGN
jgi:hypothetical protein